MQRPGDGPAAVGVLHCHTEIHFSVACSRAARGFMFGCFASLVRESSEKTAIGVTFVIPVR